MKTFYFTLLNRLSRKKRKYNEAYWDQKAAVFSGDAISLWPNSTLNDLYHHSHLRLLADHVGDLKGKRILDVGCGVGRLSYFFAQQGATVNAIDWSTNTIEQAKKQHPHPAIHYAVQSVFDLDFDKSSYDFIIVFGVLNVACQNEADLKKVISLFHGLLKKEGVLLVFEPIHAIKMFARNLLMSRKGFLAILREQKFAILYIRNIHFLFSHLVLSVANFPKILTQALYWIGEFCLGIVRNKILGDYFFVVAKKED